MSAILALNNDHAVELSWLDAARLAALVRQAFHARWIGADAPSRRGREDQDDRREREALHAFLIAFDETAQYDNPNYRWFRERYGRFVYVDRVAVAAEARGRGHARRLYDELFERAASAGHAVVCCEVNCDPPNPASDAFHAALGFVEVGGAVIHGGQKTVRYLVRPIAARGG